MPLAPQGVGVLPHLLDEPPGDLHAVEGLDFGGDVGLLPEEHRDKLINQESPKKK